MRPLSSSEILGLWERGVSLHPLDRGLLVLEAAGPSPAGSVADWPLGRRNRALLELHASCFTPRLQGWTACPDCGDKVEFELDARQLMGAAEQVQPPLAVTVGGQDFRLPTSRDVAQVAGISDLDAAAVRLALSCPSCKREWEDAFDIGRFVWAEVESRARRLVWEVHSLASAYGWGESETLALSAARRAMYLEMVHA
jgi:hypothetical protein